MPSRPTPLVQTYGPWACRSLKLHEEGVPSWLISFYRRTDQLTRYPYPPETYENVFAQLSAIVDGEAPGLPEDDEITDEEEIEFHATGAYGASPGWCSTRKGKRRWSSEARDWVRQCLIKNADERATYKELLEHPWMQADRQREVDMVSWVTRAIQWRDRGMSTHSR